MTAEDSAWKFETIRDRAVVVVVDSEEKEEEVMEALRRLTRLKEKFSVALEPWGRW